MSRGTTLVIIMFSLLVSCSAWAGGTPQSTAFTYQGVFKVGGTPANGTHHLRFQLFDALTAGAQVGADFDAPTLAIDDGLFTAALDFGPGAFDGSARWLAVQVITNGGSTVTTLTPRQPLNAAPYAIYALSANGPSLTNLNASNLSSGVVPGAQLGGAYGNAVTFSHAGNIFAGAFTGSGAALTGLSASNVAAGNLASARLPTGGPWTLSSNLNLDSNTLVIDQANNRVGIGTASPQATLHLVTGGEGLRLQGPANSIDNTAWMQFNNAAGTRIGYLGDGSTTDNSMYLTADVGDIHLYTAIGAALTAKPSGNVGIGTTTPAKALTINGDMEIGTGAGDYQHLRIGGGNASGFLYGSFPALGDGIHMGYNYYHDAAGVGHVATPGGGTSRISMGYGYITLGASPLGVSPPTMLYLTDDAVSIATTSQPVGFNLAVSGSIYSLGRVAINLPGAGQLMEFRVGEVAQGSISVVGSTVSYNGFMGSHYAWTDGKQSIDRGALVRMTGENRRLNDSAESDVVYGIEPTASANDSACLGAYLGIMESDKPAGLVNPYLVAAVGNGEMLVVDSGTGDIQPGDYLISSDVPGCAMKDDPKRFAVGHVIARAAQRVDWSAMPAAADGGKVARVSVFFESFFRQSEVQSVARRVDKNADIEAPRMEKDREIGAMRDRLEQLEKLVDQMARRNRDGR